MPNKQTLNDGRQYLKISIGALFFSLLAALAMASGALWLAQHLLIRAPSYPDFIVGAITWDAATKLQDLASYPAFLLGFLGGGWITSRLFLQLSKSKSNEYEQDFITTLAWWLVPIAIGFGGFLSIYPSVSSFALTVGGTGLFMTAIAVRLNMRYSDMMPQQLGIGVLAVLLIGLLPYGLATIQDRLPVFHEALRFKVAHQVSALIVIATALYFFYLCRKSSTVFYGYLSKLLLIAQLGLAPFFLLILPDLYLTGSEVPAIHTTGWLWALSLALVLAAVVDVIIRYKNFVTNNSTDLTLLLSPLALYATVILLRNAATALPQIPTDDYHFGESLLGWWSMWEFGKIPYIDYFPPHGIFGDEICGFLSLIFYDGTAATIVEAERLAGTLTMLGVFMALRAYTGSLGLAYVSILLFGTVSRKLHLLILVPFYCLWLKASNLNPQNWLWMWLISATLLVFLVPPQGLVAVAASFPLVAIYLYRARSFAWHWKWVALLAAVAGVLALFTPIPAMLYGAIQYVLENGKVNQIAYGLPWTLSWGDNVVNKLEILRMSWIWVALVAAVLMVVVIKQREYRFYAIGVALPILLFVSLLTPYTMGRIDPNALSRPGILANFAWAALLPLLLAPLLATRGRAVLAVGIAFVCAAIGLANINKEGFHSVLEKNQIGALWLGAEHGLNNMGNGLVESQHVERLKRINNFLISYLAPRETYLDLTGHNADYMYFDRPPAMSTTAPYNLANIQEQLRIVKRLSKSIPRVALIEADNINHDGVGPSLRAHVLYRFVINNYEAELHDGYVYGIAKTAGLPRVGIDFTIKQFTDPNWENGVSRADKAVVIRDALAVRYLRVGDNILLPDNKPRKITRVWPEGNAIWFDGVRFLPSASDSHREVQVVLDERRRQELSAQLMNHVFAVADLRKVPVAWGLSAASLAAGMKQVADLDFSHAALHDLTPAGDNFHVAGTDPYMWLDLTLRKIAGQSAGLLKFDVFCEGATNPRMQIFWWGDEMVGAAPSQSLYFTAANGTVIVPLDAYPGWLEMKQIKGLRIDLDNAAACQKFAVKNMSLNQRINFSE
jgi:hypothetical protein